MSSYSSVTNEEPDSSSAERRAFKYCQDLVRQEPPSPPCILRPYTYYWFLNTEICSPHLVDFDIALKKHMVGPFLAPGKLHLACETSTIHELSVCIQCNVPLRINVFPAGVKFYTRSGMSQKLNLYSLMSRLLFLPSIFTHRKYDHDHYMCNLLLPWTLQAAAFTIRSFNVEVAQIGDIVTERNIGVMRIQFWRDLLDSVYKVACILPGRQCMYNGDVIVVGRPPSAALCFGPD